MRVLVVALLLVSGLSPTTVEGRADDEAWLVSRGPVHLEGSAGLAGPLVALRARSDSTPANLVVDVSGALLRVETDRQAADYSANGVAINEHPRSTSGASHVDSAGIAHPSQLHQEVWILPLPGGGASQLTVGGEVSCASGSPEEVRPTLWASGTKDRSGWRANAASSIDCVARSGGAYEVVGDFRVALYGWNLTVGSGPAAAAYPSGERSEPVARDPLGALRGVRSGVEVRQLFLEIRNGSLRLPGSPRVSVDAWLEEASGPLGGRLLADTIAARVRLDGRQQEASGRLDLRGSGALRLQSGQQGITALFSGTIEQARVGSAWLVKEETSQTAPAFPWRLALLGAPLVILAAATSIRQMAGIERRRARTLEDALEAGDWEASLRAASSLRGRGEFSQHAGAGRIEALARMGRLRDARAAWEAAAGLPPALRHYFLAFIEACEGRMAPARRSLAMAVALAPEFGTLARQEPVFLPLVSTQMGVQRRSKGGAGLAGYA